MQRRTLEEPQDGAHGILLEVLRELGETWAQVAPRGIRMTHTNCGLEQHKGKLNGNENKKND